MSANEKELIDKLLGNQVEKLRLENKLYNEHCDELDTQVFNLQQTKEMFIFNPDRKRLV